MTDYSKSKYQDELTEWASSIANEGFAVETAGDLSEGRDWYALVTLDYDAGDPDTIAAATDGIAGLFQGSAIIIREDSQGFVWTMYGPVHPLGDPGAWRALMSAWADIVAADDSEAYETARRMPGEDSDND